MWINVDTRLASLIQHVTRANDCVQTTALICWPAGSSICHPVSKGDELLSDSERWSSPTAACGNTCRSVYTFRVTGREEEEGAGGRRMKSAHFNECEMIFLHLLWRKVVH